MAHWEAGLMSLFMITIQVLWQQILLYRDKTRTRTRTRRLRSIRGLAFTLLSLTEDWTLPCIVSVVRKLPLNGGMTTKRYYTVTTVNLS